MRHEIMILLIILATGLFGGLINFLQGYKDTEDKLVLFFKSSGLGIAASILVPLFLETISSDLIDKETMRGYLTFTGFCLVASIFSRRFIDTLGDKILAKAKEAEIKADQALVKSTKNEDKVDTMIELSSDEQTTRELSYDELQEQLRSKIEKDQYKVIDSMLNPDFKFRTVKGISDELKINQEIVIGILEELLKGGIVKQIENKKGQQLWSITITGRRAYEKLIKERSQD